MAGLVQVNGRYRQQRQRNLDSAVAMEAGQKLEWFLA